MQSCAHVTREPLHAAIRRCINRAAKTRLASIIAIAAILACNAAVPLVAVAAAIGFTIVIDPFLQALTVSGLAALAAIFVVISERQHRLRTASILALIGAAAVFVTMFVAFDKVVETLAMLALLGSSLWARRPC